MLKASEKRSKVTGNWLTFPTDGAKVPLIMYVDSGKIKLTFFD